MDSRFIKSIPLLFALLWSTGFIGAKFGLPYIGPYSFLAIRFAITILLLGGLIFLLRPAFPTRLADYLHLFVSGVLIHAAYLGGVFTAIKLGLPAGMTAVIVGMQPILTVLFFYGFRSPLILLASLIGFVGLLFVVGEGVFVRGSSQLAFYLPTFLALMGITFGTIYQKKFSTHVDVLTIAFLQYIPTLGVFTVLALVYERSDPIVWHPELIFAMIWLVVVLSIGAIFLMSLLYRHYSASRAANYFYLAPPFTLLQGYLFFGESFGFLNLLGIVMIVFSLYWTGRLQQKYPAS